MLVDANILLYAVDESSPFHPAARTWIEGAMNGARRVGLPWATLGAFLRIATNPRALESPMRPAQAWAVVESWLDRSVTWIPQPSDRHARILGQLIVELDLRANQIPDAQLAALAVEHGLTIISADTDFARFTDVAWENPLV